MGNYMDGLGQSGYLSQIAAGYQDDRKTADRKNGTAKESQEKAAALEGEKKLNEVSGRTIGQPKLSDKALKYYEQLKKRYSNMDFVLVSPEMKAEAERNKGMIPSSKQLLVLIDADKIERMALLWWINHWHCRGSALQKNGKKKQRTRKSKQKRQKIKKQRKNGWKRSSRIPVTV